MSKKRRTYVSFDWAMKRLLRNKANFSVLEGFLSTLFEKQVVINALLESESNKATSDNKKVVVDLLCRLDLGELAIIEVQYFHEVDYFQRMLFGVSKILTDYLNKGDAYQDVKKVYSVNLVYFDLGHGTDYVYHGITEFRGKNKGDLLGLSKHQEKRFGYRYPKDIYPEFYVLKINAFNNIAKTPLDEWIYFFKNSELPKNGTTKNLSLLVEQLKYETMSVKERKAYDRYRENLLISKSMLASAFDEGQEKGMEKGMETAIVKVALNAWRKGFTTLQIAELTGASETQIKKYLESQDV